MMFVIYIACNWHTKCYPARSPLPTTCSLQHGLTTTTVDGNKNPALPARMYKTYEIIGKTIYQLVQDFFHQQYVCFCVVSLCLLLILLVLNLLMCPIRATLFHINCTLQQTYQVSVCMHAFKHSDSHYVYIVIFMHVKVLYDTWLVGGWTNPSEKKTLVNMGIFPKIKKIFETTTTQLITSCTCSLPWLLLDFSCMPRPAAPPSCSSISDKAWRSRCTWQ